jgi:N4-(beta-N-acetylglucosaminyl)-L-asparaginase
LGQDYLLMANRGAAATGSGELVMKTLGSFLVVEFMRNGMSPGKACNAAIARITKKIPDYHNHQIGYIADKQIGRNWCCQSSAGFRLCCKIKYDI